MSNLDVCDTHRKERKKARITAQSKATVFKSPKPIKKVSEKRKAKLREYTPLRKQYLLDHPECEIRLIGCEGKSVEIHHCSMSDKDFLNIDTWKGSCVRCHQITERFLTAKERREKGVVSQFEFFKNG